MCGLQPQQGGGDGKIDQQGQNVHDRRDERACHDCGVKLRLFLDWGIRFGMPYEVPEKAQRFVAYADKQELEESIIRRHNLVRLEDVEEPQDEGDLEGDEVWSD